MADEALLWDLSDSPFCMKARMLLQLKGVPYRRIPLTVRNRRALRAIAPRGTVPVLVHRGRVVADSTDIARWLDAEVPDPPLWPRDPAARAFADLVEDWADESLAPLAGAVTMLAPASRRIALDRLAAEMGGGLPRWLLRPALGRHVDRGLAARGFTAAALPALEERLGTLLATLGSLLEGRPFLLGRAPTVADVAAFAPLARLALFPQAQLVDAAPDVAAWCARMRDVPAIADAVPG